MRTTIYAFLPLALLSLSAAAEPQQVVYPKSEIRFTAKQMNVPTEGHFRKFSANATFDPNKPEAGQVTVDVDLGSVDLGDNDSNTEVKSKAWFNVAAFPAARFSAAGFKALGNGRFEAAGKLSIKGITKDIVAPFSVKADSSGNLTIEGSVPIQRLTFKLGEGAWADTDTVANEVIVKYRVALTPPRK